MVLITVLLSTVLIGEVDELLGVDFVLRDCLYSYSVPYKDMGVETIQGKIAVTPIGHDHQIIWLMFVLVYLYYVFFILGLVVILKFELRV